jgi:hypothetical protein
MPSEATTHRSRQPIPICNSQSMISSARYSYPIHGPAHVLQTSCLLASTASSGTVLPIRILAHTSLQPTQGSRYAISINSLQSVGPRAVSSYSLRLDHAAHLLNRRSGKAQPLSEIAYGRLSRLYSFRTKVPPSFRSPARHTFREGWLGGECNSALRCRRTYAVGSGRRLATDLSSPSLPIRWQRLAFCRYSHRFESVDPEARAGPTMTKEWRQNRLRQNDAGRL